MRLGKDATIVAIALMVPRAIQAADKLMIDHGIDVEVDIRTLVPFDMKTISSSVAKLVGYLMLKKTKAMRLGS